MKCPCCNKVVNKDHFSCVSGAKGGQKTGKSKARSPEAIQRAVDASLAARGLKRKNS